MEMLRTPDERFEELKDYAYTPHYLELDDLDGGSLRMHYVDEGPRDARPVLLVHGEPTWGYLYRKMIPGLLAAGLRVVVPDLVGMGRSDKPAQQKDYTFVRHVSWLRSWLNSLDLQGSVFFGQDWGSLIGLTVVTLEAERFDAIVLGNGGLPDPEHMERVAELRAASPDEQAFARWQKFSQEATELHCGDMVSASLNRFRGSGLSDAERAAYDAPFPDPSYQAAALIFPSLVTAAGEGGDATRMFSAAWRVLESWEKPLLTAYGKADPVLGWADKLFQLYVPGAKGQPHVEFEDGGHFIQEQYPDDLVEAITGLAAGL
jgi:haloalkane dehalogenase